MNDPRDFVLAKACQLDIEADMWNLLNDRLSPQTVEWLRRVAKAMRNACDENFEANTVAESAKPTEER